MKPDQSLFMAHLEGASFKSGVDAGKWGLSGAPAEIAWPNPIMWVAADSTIVAGGKLFLRFSVDNYPASAPTACLWDISTNSRLAANLYPSVTGKFRLVFRTDWNGGNSLYAPCDRMAMAGHEQWKQSFPYWWWTPEFTIVKYLSFVHICLNPMRYEDKTA
jgi:hypothetical protein